MIDRDEFDTSIPSNGCNQPLDTGAVVTAPLNVSICDGAESEANRRTRCVTDIEDDHHEYRTRSIERDHQSKHLQLSE